MRYLLLFMLLVGLFMFGRNACHIDSFGFGIKGEGPLKTETRDISDFHAVEVAVASDVEVSVADNYFVEVQTHENLLPVLKTKVENGTLRIYFDESVSYSEGLKIRVSAPAFDRFSLGGSGTIKVITPIRSDRMELEIAGSGDIFIPQGTFNTLVTSIAGSGGIELGGTADTVKSEIAGSGDVKGKQLTTRELDASIAGSGSVTFDVAETLKVEIAGSGDVFYSGDPTVDADVSGSGKVKKLTAQ